MADLNTSEGAASDLNSLNSTDPERKLLARQGQDDLFFEMISTKICKSESKINKNGQQDLIADSYDYVQELLQNSDI